MATITKDQLQNLIKNRPEGVTVTELLKGLEQRGHTIQGIEKPRDTLQTIQGRTEKQEDSIQSEGQGFLSSVGDFILPGVETFGEAIGQTAFNVLGDFGIIPEKEQLDTLVEEGSITPEEFAEATGANIDPQEVVASAALTGMNIVLPGVGGKLASGVARVGKGVTAKTGSNILGKAAGGATAIGGESLIGGAFAGAGAAEERGDVRDIINSAIAGGTIGALFPVGKTVTGKGFGVFGGASKRALSVLSGRSVPVINTALSRPKQAAEGLKKGSEVLLEVAKDASKTINSMRQQMQKNFNQGMQRVFKQLGDRQFNNTKISLREKTNEILEDFAVTPKKNKISPNSFSESAITKSGERSNVIDAFNTIHTWKDWTAPGIIKLRQRLGALRNFESGKETRSSSVIGKLYYEVNKQLEREAKDIQSTEPKIAKALRSLRIVDEEFESRNDFLKTIEKILGNAENDTASRLQMASRLAALFNRNKENARRFIKQLEVESNTDILGRTAGAQLTEDVTKGVDLFTNMIRVTGIPDFVARRTITIGRAVQILDRMGDVLGRFNGLQDSIKFNIIRELSDQEQTADTERAQESRRRAR